jgi:integrase
VYLRHGAYWYVKGGKWKRLAADLPTALERYARIVCEPKGGMTDLINTVLEHIRPRLAPNTVKNYEVAGRQLKDVFAEFAPGEVRPRHVGALKVSMAAKPNMGNRLLSLLRVVFQYAVEWQLVDSNPCIGILRLAEKKRTRYITDDEYQAIYAKAGARLQIIMDLLYLTGQRVSDVLAIRRADLTDQGIRFKQGKTGAQLSVRWTPALTTVVDRAKAMHGKIERLTLLFNRRRKAPDYSTVRDQWQEACEAAGVKDAHIHDLRAKSLTDAKMQGKDPQALAGHTNPAMTARYIKLRETPLVEGPTFGRPLDKQEKTA